MTKPDRTAGSNYFVIPLVGAFFRPPAKQLLSVLPAGAQLQLLSDPDNPWDPKAIMVLVDPRSEIPEESTAQLDLALSGTGWIAEEILASAEPQHLGYLMDSDGKIAAGRPGNPSCRVPSAYA